MWRPHVVPQTCAAAGGCFNKPQDLKQVDKVPRATVRRCKHLSAIITIKIIRQRWRIKMKYFLGLWG